MRTVRMFPAVLLRAAENEFVYQVAPPPGARTVSVGVVVIAKLMMPLASTGPLEVTRTRAVPVVGPVTFQAKLPLVPLMLLMGAASASVSYEPPPSRLNSTRTVSLAGKL